MRYRSHCLYCDTDYFYEESWWSHHFGVFINPFYIGKYWQCEMCAKAIRIKNEKKDRINAELWKKQRAKIISNKTLNQPKKEVLHKQ